MAYSVLRGAAYALIQGNDIALHQGSTAASERHANAASDFLRELPAHFRDFGQAVAYPPNQAFIGNIHPRQLLDIPRPWYQHGLDNASAEGEYGAILPEEMLYGLMKAVDTFDLVLLDEDFLAPLKERLRALPGVGDWPALEKLDKNPADAALITKILAEQHAEPLYFKGEIIGCVKRAHEFDAALTAHVLFENLAAKASACFALQQLLNQGGLKASDVEYIIECSEEACGDMNQRGGGNFAKAIGEICGCVNATGSDTRSFCAGPAHAMVEAAALVQAGVYRHVAVVAGGATAKLGMNSRDHVKKGLPMLEDMLGAFAAHIGVDDQVSPLIRTDIVGRHKIGSGASPQAVMQAIVAAPLDAAGLKIADIDLFSAEMQNPEITEPAGAGDVPSANFKMIAALGVMRGEFEKSELPQVVKRIGLPGFAPTQGHIPSGMPLLAHFREMMLQGEIQRAMIIGKGSLFLGRLTNLFDGVSFVLEANPGPQPAARTLGGLTRTRVALTVLGSEHPASELIRGAELAEKADPLLEVVLLGAEAGHGFETVAADTPEACLSEMDRLLAAGQAEAAVAMHYPFPLGVATVGRIVTPALGRKMYISTTTGAIAADRVAAMVKNAVAAIAAAKACGNAAPSLGLLNLEGARQAERILRQLQANGYEIKFAESGRADGGAVMRGNDLLTGAADIMVADSLTGNVLIKLFSAYTSGGNYEAVGDGYGPGVGEKYGKIVNIISRASGAPVVAGAIAFAAQAARGGLPRVAAAEFAAAEQAGLSGLLAGAAAATAASAATEEIRPPAEKVATEEITGVEVFVIEDAVRLLWKQGVYASAGMGCTGPVVMVAEEDAEQALSLLKEGGYL